MDYGKGDVVTEGMQSKRRMVAKVEVVGEVGCRGLRWQRRGKWLEREMGELSGKCCGGEVNVEGM